MLADRDANELPRVVTNKPSSTLPSFTINSFRVDETAALEPPVRVSDGADCTADADPSSTVAPKDPASSSSEIRVLQRLWTGSPPNSTPPLPASECLSSDEFLESLVQEVRRSCAGLYRDTENDAKWLDQYLRPEPALVAAAEPPASTATPLGASRRMPSPSPEPSAPVVEELVEVTGSAEPRSASPSAAQEHPSWTPKVIPKDARPGWNQNRPARVVRPTVSAPGTAPPRRSRSSRAESAVLSRSASYQRTPSESRAQPRSESQPRGARVSPVREELYARASRAEERCARLESALRAVVEQQRACEERWAARHAEMAGKLQFALDYIQACAPPTTGPSPVPGSEVQSTPLGLSNDGSGKSASIRPPPSGPLTLRLLSPK